MNRRTHSEAVTPALAFDERLAQVQQDMSRLCLLLEALAMALGVGDDLGERPARQAVVEAYRNAFASVQPPPLEEPELWPDGRVFEPWLTGEVERAVAALNRIGGGALALLIAEQMSQEVKRAHS